MAEDHAKQDSAERRAAKAPPVDTGVSARDETPVEAPAARIRVVAGALNLCWIAALWPALVTRALSPADIAGCLSVLLLIAVGYPARMRRGFVRPSAWLIGLPAVITSVLATRPAVVTERAYGPLAITVLLASFVLYGALAAQACTRSSPRVPTRQTTLRDRSEPPPAVRRSWLQVIVLALAFVGAVVLAAVAPLWGGPDELRQAWGEAAPYAGVLTALVGGSLAVATLAVFAGSALRPSGEPLPSEVDRPMRVALYLFLTLLGAVTYVVVKP